MAKNKKKKQRKLGTLVLLLFLSVVLLSTSTYAWFTANKNIKVSDIDVTVAAQGGIQISTDATNWKTVISNGDITGAKGSGYSGAKNQLPGVLSAVSTAGTVANGYMNMYSGKVKSDASGNFTLYSTKAAENDGTVGDFIAFDIFIKSDSAANVTLRLDPGSGAVTTSGSTSKGLEYATRIAFIKEGFVAKDTENIATAAQALSGGTSALIYEPNFEGHTAYGVEQANTYYKDTLGENTITAGTNSVKIDTDGLDSVIAEESAILLSKTNAKLNSTIFKKQDTTVLKKAFVDAEDGEGPQTFATISPGITKYRVYMWIEGQDVDCENNASGSNITFRLAFSVA